LKTAKLVKNAVAIQNHKLAACMKLNEKFYYKTLYRKRQLVGNCRVEQGGATVTFIMYSCQLIKVWIIVL